MKINRKFLDKNGMTLPEVSLALMVLVIFASLISLSAKFLQGSLKRNFSLNSENKSWIRNEHEILKAMDKWEQVLSQPSITKEKVESIGCNLEDLIESRPNAKPGIYFIYAIPSEVSPTSKPLRKVICRPITFC